MLAILVMQPFAIAQFPFGLSSERMRGNTERESESEEDEIETDRDSFTPSTSVVGRGRVVVESAYSFIDNLTVPETHSLPEVVGRFGLTETVELRLGYNYEVGGAGSPISGNVPDDFEEEPEIERESRIFYGTKIWLSEQEGWIPQSSVLLQGYTPTLGKSTDTHFSTTSIFGWKLRNAWVWDSGIRYSSGSLEEDRFNVWSPSTVLKVPIGEKWKAHVEYFGVYTDGREKETTLHFFSPGIHYLFTSNLELGVRVGWGLNDQAPNFFSNVGGGFRF